MAELQELIGALASGDDDRAEAAVPALAGQGEEALSALGELLKSPQADLRWWAARALAEFSIPQALELRLSALSDDDSGVRACAALGLRERPDPRAIPALIQMLSDPDRLCAAMAADALVAIGEEAVPALLEVMASGAQPARLEAVRALAEIGDHRAIPVLFTALDDESIVVQHWASEGLERMGVGMNFYKP